MAPNAIHAEYAASAGAWSRARDVIAGEDAVKAAGERYLPKLDSQSAEEYAAYKMRALFFSATARTADGFVGLIFRRAPFMRGLGDSEPSNHAKDTKVANEAPSPQPSPPRGRGSSALGKAMAEFSNDADMLGTSLYGYAKNVVTEVISVGRAGTLVDWEGEVEDRAYATLYAAEDILNWRMERIYGRNLLTMLALHEVADGKGQMADGKEDEAASVEQIRVVRLELIRICFLLSNVRNCRHAVMEHCFSCNFIVRQLILIAVTSQAAVGSIFCGFLMVDGFPIRGHWANCGQTSRLTGIPPHNCLVKMTKHQTFNRR